MFRFQSRCTPQGFTGVAVGLALSAVGVSALAQPAFPGAEGFGAAAIGGRGGRVVKVTTLAAAGPGSLQDALDQSGPRIVVFDVDGVIEGDILIPHGDVTIAGESAPGAGITLRGRLYAAYNESVTNMIVRFLRVRPPPLTGGSDGDQYDAIQFSRNSLFIFDHVSVSWASDETVDLYGASDATLQWCTIEESSTEGHPEGEHNYGLINGPEGHRLSLHHNLFAHHRSRSPAVANGPADIRNNVVYDAFHAFVHNNPASGDFNIVGNYYREGPSADLFPFYFDDEDGEGVQYYLHNNYIDDPTDFTGMVDNPWKAGALHPSFDDMLGNGRGVETEFDFAKTHPGYVRITMQDAVVAYNAVLAGAGAFPRDVVTRRTVREVKERNGSWGANPPADLLEGLAPEAPAADTDGDGMPDVWESGHGLDPDDPSDASQSMSSGYTAIEDYLHTRAASLLGADLGAGGGGGVEGGGGGTGAGAGEAGAGAAEGGAGAVLWEGPHSVYEPGEPPGCACGLSRTTSGHRNAALFAVLAAAGLLGARRRRGPSVL